MDYVSWYRKLTEKQGKTNAYDALTKLAASSGSKDKLPGEEYREEALYYPFDDLARGGIVWKPKDLPNVDSYLCKIDERVIAFERTTSIPHYWRALPADAKRMRSNEPILGSHCRHAIRALLVRGWKQGPRIGEQLTRAHCAVSGHCLQLRQSTDMINWMVSNLHTSGLCLSIRAALDQGLLSLEEIEKTIDSLARLGQARLTFDRMLCKEWGEDLDMLQNVFPGGKHDEKQYNKMKEVYGEISIPQCDADPHAMLDTVNETYDRMIDIAGGPLTRKTWKRIEKHLNAVYPNREMPVFKYPDALASMGRGYLLFLEAEADRRATLLSLAIHRTHIKDDKWPRRLDDLKLKDLSKIRIDPFSAQDFKYRIKNGKPLLYSVAVDGIDDKGAHNGRWEGSSDDNVDYVFLPYQEPMRFHFKERNPKPKE